MTARRRERLAWVVTAALLAGLAWSLWPEQAHTVAVVAGWVLVAAVVVSGAAVIAALVLLWVIGGDEPVDLDAADGVRLRPLTPAEHERAKRLRDEEWRSA